MSLNVVYVWYITTVPGTFKWGSSRATISFDVEMYNQPTVNPFRVGLRFLNSSTPVLTRS